MCKRLAKPDLQHEEAEEFVRTFESMMEKYLPFDDKRYKFLQQVVNFTVYFG